jgi:radical SAM superfamily enzyme YgiQ (UPF0313 family)
MSSLGFQTIYDLFNRFDRVVCERVFSGRSASLGETGREEWASGGRAAPSGAGPGAVPLALESQRHLADFAVVAFTVSYELDYFNLVQALREAGIPLLAEERGDRHPLVIAGGPCITANPAPLVPFLDVLAVGEGEVIIPPLVEALTDTMGSPRQGVLEALARVPGLYVPALANPVSRQWVRDLDSYATTSVVLTQDTSLGDMYLIEVARGCAWGCRFCLASFVFRPFRPRSPKVLLEQARAGLHYRKRIGLVGAAVSDYPCVEELVGGLREMGASLAASSLRLRPLPEVLVEALVATGARTLTFAPEAGSERLRQVIGKGVSQEDIFRGVELAARLRVKRLKFYFMVGLPEEQDGDEQELIRLCLACRRRLDDASPGTELAVNLTPFVPKACTPFQWEPMAEVEVLEEKLRRIRRGLRQARIKVKAGSPAWYAVQGMLARGDGRLVPVLAALNDNTPSAWQRALEAAGIAPGTYLRGRSMEEPLPWDFIDSGLPRHLLGREQGRAHGGA